MQDVLALASGICIGILVIGAGLLLLRPSRAHAAESLTQRPSESVVLLGPDGTVLDSTRDAREIAGGANLDGASWDDLHHLLVPHFPDLPDRLPDAPAAYFTERAPEVELRISPGRDHTRIALLSSTTGPGAQLQLTGQSGELERLNAAFDVAPNPIWFSDDANRVIWSNQAYETLCKSTSEDGTAAPFDLDLSGAEATLSTRARIDRPDGNPRWFEVTSRRDGDGWMHFANDIDTLIEAELAQRNFVQTLTKTFAHLPIGLAVFDRDRRLVLFNPALVDLTHLPVDFLSARPNLSSFFDHMRDNRMMPEPKNYASWREQLNDVIAAARDDRYCETWSLASGLTYKITGRPHPDGAVAFLLEDISAEISLTRRFRSELELTLSVIDSFDDAVAVFSRLGVLSFSNAAYRSLWDCDPDSAFDEVTISDATQDWQEGCEPTPIWSELRDYVTTMQDRTAWDAPLQLCDGRKMTCCIEPVNAGATMVRFTEGPAPKRRLIAEPVSDDKQASKAKAG